MFLAVNHKFLEA